MTRTGNEVATPVVTNEPITRWSPFDEVSELRHRMDDLFNRSFGYTPLSRLLPSEPPVFEPIFDLYELENQIDAFVMLPGYTPESIHVNATLKSVNIVAEKKCLYDEKAFVRRQGWVAAPGSINVNYTLPCEIAPNMVKAHFVNGILHLVMPKSETAVTKSFKVSVQPT